MRLRKIFSNYSGMPNESKYLIYASILPAVAYGLIFTDISYFLTIIQGVSADFTGLVISAMGISTFVASIFLGIASDIYGRKRMLIVGNLLASVMLAVFAFATDPVVLLVAAIGEGISEAAVTASSSALLADKVGSEKRTSLFSLYGFIQNLAFAIGSFAVSFVIFFELIGLSDKSGHIVLYLIIAILSAVSTLLMLKVSESVKLKKLSADRIDFLPKKSKDVLLKYVLTGAILAFGAGMVVPLMTLWFNLQYGISDKISATILAASSVLIGFATLVAPLIAKKFGLVKAIVITQLASTFFMFLVPFSPNYVLAGFVYGIRALLMNMASPLSQSMIMGLVAEDERGAVSGISGALWRLPNALSTFVGAWLMGIGLLAEPFLIASLLYVISIVLFWYYFRRVRMPEEEALGS
ncbi:MAG: MFS transporter [Candidatus Bathyarchaeota archaeon]|nr:MFS transporter [Candidatus Bathyarchaeota archaeon]